MMKKARQGLCLFLFFITLFSTAIANDEAWVTAERFLNQVMDFKEEELFRVNAPEYGSDELSFWFDFRDGWHLIMVLHDGKAISTYPMDVVKVLNGLSNLLPLFPQIQAQMPKGVEASFTVTFSDENRQVITLENYWDYLWY